MLHDSWVIVDTETTGLSTPISAVEIAAQKMKGWHRDGDPFRVLLNHDVPIEPMAESLHGYSRAFLRKHGEDPRCAHLKFYDYAGDLPLVAYNLSYDWNRVLEPEYRNLGVRPTGRKGFCAMTLSRRSITGTQNFKLETLKDHFGLSGAPSHQGWNDVEALTRLFESVLSSRLDKAGLFGFEKIAAFSREAPVARCLEQILGVGEAVWYYVNQEEKAVGPLTAAQVRAIIGVESAFVWREGMPSWTPSADLPEFAPPAAAKKTRTRKKRNQSTAIAPAMESKPRFETQQDRWLDEVIGLCRGILADGEVNEREVISLQEWLMSCPCTQLYPISAIAEQVEQIICDGVITADELEDLKATLEAAIPGSSSSA